MQGLTDGDIGSNARASTSQNHGLAYSTNIPLPNQVQASYLPTSDNCFLFTRMYLKFISRLNFKTGADGLLNRTGLVQGLFDGVGSNTRASISQTAGPAYSNNTRENGVQAPSTTIGKLYLRHRRNSFYMGYFGFAS